MQTALKVKVSVEIKIYPAAHKLQVSIVMTSSEEIARVELLVSRAGNGDLNTIRYLVEEKGTNINSLNRVGDSALCVASGHEQEFVVKYLLAKGAQADFMTGGDYLRTRGVTALCFAAADGNVGICKLLLEHGADPNLKARVGKSYPCCS